MANNIKPEGFVKVRNNLTDLVKNSKFSVKDISELTGIDNKLIKHYMEKGDIPLTHAMTLAYFFETPLSNLTSNELYTYQFSVADRILQLREDNNLSQEEAAKYLGITKGALSKMETGGNSVDIPTIHCLANLYNVSPSYILGEIPEKSLMDYAKKRVQVAVRAEKLKPLAEVNSIPFEHAFIPEELSHKSARLEDIKKKSKGSLNASIGICNYLKSLIEATYKEIDNPLVSAESLKTYLHYMVDNIVELYDKELTSKYGIFNDPLDEAFNTIHLPTLSEEDIAELEKQSEDEEYYNGPSDEEFYLYNDFIRKDKEYQNKQKLVSELLSKQNKEE